MASRRVVSRSLRLNLGNGISRRFMPVAARRFATMPALRQESSKPEQQEHVPWYLQDPDALQSTESSKFNEPVPELPSGIYPERMQPVAEYMVKEMGLVDLEVLDLRNMDPPSSLGPNAILVLASGKSDKHLIRAANGLHKFIKNEYGVVSDREGILTSNFLRVHARRQRKKAQRQFFFQTENEDGVLQRMNSWVVIDTKMDSVIVHLFTPQRREEVALKEHFQSEQEDPVGEPSQPTRMPTGKREYHTQNEAPRVRDPIMSTVFAGQYTKAARTVPKDTDGKLVLKAHINKLQREMNRKDMTLHERSGVVLSLMDKMPPVLDAEDWSLRLVFLQAAHFFAPQQFPLRKLVDYVVSQQASGFVVNEWDVETALLAIVYSKQEFSHASREAPNDRRAEEDKWLKECNTKMNYVLELFDVAYRPSGKPISASQTIMGLLYRLCINARSPEYMDVQSTVKAPKPDNVFKRGVLDTRASTIFQLADPMNSATNSAGTKNFIALSLTSLANDRQWAQVWSVWKDVKLMAVIDEPLLSLFVSLVVKSGDVQAITHLLADELPQTLASAVPEKPLMSRRLIKAVQNGLDYINPKRNGYLNLRGYLQEEKAILDTQRSK